MTNEFTCPGIAMAQPEGAPEEGYVSCFIAGHKCVSTVTRTTDERGTETRIFCGCCGDFRGSTFIPAWMEVS